jgi:hypothetical protein
MTEKTSNGRGTRRTFLKEIVAASAVGAAGGLLDPAASPAQPAPASTQGAQSAAGGVAGQTVIEIRDGRLHVETGTLTAVIDQGTISSLRSKASGEEFVKGTRSDGPAALQILYRAGETVSIDEEKYGSIQCRKISDSRAEVIFHSWDGDGVLAVSADPETGDLILEPSTYASRPGVRACRWTMRGLRSELRMVAPFFQGVRLKLDDPLVRNSRWEWPQAWEAGFAIFESQNGGFWVHTRDSSYRYKGLKIGTASDPYSVGLDSEAYGPIDSNLSAGGLAWRINVYAGDWKIPAGMYRDWLWRAYGLDAAQKSRRPWIYDLRLAISWCPGNLDILDALAKRVDPRRVLIHFPGWRTDEYDENYPTFVASENGRAFAAKGRAMGFHVMPHFNSVDMDPSNPVYSRVRDFQYRSIEDMKILGWSWVDGKVLGVPESGSSLFEHRDKKLMVKIHPGLGMWRAILGQRVLEAAQALSLETVFLDVTLNTFNLHNSLVEATTSTEGMKRLIEHVAALGSGLVVGGEGLNEITAQGLSFGQVHLFKSWQTSTQGLERTGGCPLNEFVLGRLSRAFGYSGLGGENADEQLRMRIHEEHGAIPTITISSAKEITDPNPAVKRVLDQAAG